MYQLLTGVRVVEGASFIAAPYCGLTLVQLGAEVIRFDPIGGGPDFRRWPVTPTGASLYWEGLNKGKKSVSLNLSTSEGRELAVALATAPGDGAGVFVTNYPDQGFLAHNRLAEARKDIITARVQGKADGSSAVDYTINCAVGLPFMTGPADRPDVPVNHVLPAWDLLAGSTAAVSVLAALEHRRKTGHGQEIRVPLSDIAAATLGTLGQIAEVTISGEDRPKSGNSLFGAFGRDFVTRDGNRLMVVAITSKQWESLIQALGLAEQVAALEEELGVSFQKNEGNRYLHRNRLDPMVEAVLVALPHDEVERRFNAAGVCYGLYRTLRDALSNDPSFVSANPIFSDVTHPSGITYKTSGYPATLAGMSRQDQLSAPTLGQHTFEVLRSVLRLPDHAIQQLHDRGTVQLPSNAH